MTSRYPWHGYVITLHNVLWNVIAYPYLYRHILDLCATLTHSGRVTHICIGKLTIIGSDNGLSPGRRQAIIWTNVGLLSIGPLRIYFSENLIKIQQFSLEKMHVKMSSAKWRPSCLSLNVCKAVIGNYFQHHSVGCNFPSMLVAHLID